ncbi:hypothetical protein DH2020_040423 [Rehmannia glutinosa]|uniref:Reverse transcriptase n=1 Tax=Rehmannia glutinosa TaxID=99300 RepID=A0ABR0UV55_REHGL
MNVTSLIWDIRGSCFTWANGQAGQRISEKDWTALATETWKNMHPFYRVKHIFRIKSDHNPIVVEFDGTHKKYAQNRKKRRKIFRFERMWTEHKDCEKIINQTWNSMDHTANIDVKIKRCADSLKSWERLEFGNINEKIKTLSERLDKIQKGILWVFGKGKKSDKCSTKSTRDKILRMHLSTRYPSTRESGYTLKWEYSRFDRPTAGLQHMRRKHSRKLGKNTKWGLETNVEPPNHPESKTFLWRCCTESLPTKSGLIRRGLHVDPICELCGRFGNNNTLVFRMSHN